MNDKQKLLAVLVLSEDDQWKFLIARQDIQEMCQSQLDEWSQPKYKRMVLADLAFRLRDEAVESLGEAAWHKTVVIVCGYMWKDTAWFKNYAKPIHWIIAALIAKGKL